MNIIIGINEAIVRLTNKLTFVRSLLAFSNLSSLCFSLPNALITSIPERFSRIVKFKRSINDCTILNFGITIAKVTPIKQKITNKTKPIIQVIDGVLLKALIKAPIPIIGAKHTIRMNIITTICTWVISFVVLVISDAVENLLNSSFEKLSTFSKTSRRNNLETPAPTLLAKNPQATAHTVPANAIANIFNPDHKI